MTDYIWGDAEVTYPDWQGSVQIDERMTDTSLHELVGLDSDKWMIVGVDIGGGEGEHELRVLAIDASLAPEGGNIYPRIADQHGGELPVTNFLIHDVDPYEVLKAMSHVLDLRVRVRSLIGTPIRVTSYKDVPEQR
jgi:hypothetical protein